MTRRSVVAGALTALCVGGVGHGRQAQVWPIVPVDIGHGLEIRDYRIFPTDDVRRIIVELHNISDQIIDTPSVGVVLPHLDANGNFAWASPASKVLYPGMSDVLIGVAPDELRSDADWGDPQWMVCSELTASYADVAATWDFDIESWIEIRNEGLAWLHWTTTNLSDEFSGALELRIVVRGPDGRICGVLPPLPMRGMKPMVVLERRTGIYEPDSIQSGSPFTFTDTVVGMTIEYSLQPETASIPQSCGPVLPWENN